VLTSDRITETDILDGRWDNAAVEVWRVNWADTSQRVLIRAGCDKRIETCGAKFANVANFRSFPHIPGQDTILRYATRDGGHDGGVL
jgi:hypothetical protein